MRTDSADSARDPVVIWRRRSEPAPRLLGSDVEPSQDGRVKCWLAGGRIANRDELIETTGAGREEPDTKLFLRLWQRDDREAATRIAGSFAAVLWDPERRKLVALRDRFGSQGFYWAEEGETVLISRRPRALWRVLERPAGPFIRSLVGHLQARPPLAGETFFEGIRSVWPGSMLEVSGDRIEEREYWRVERRPMLRLASDQEYQEALLELLERVVPGYLPEDPAGITLSSGMDSSSIAAALVRSGARKPVAFAWVAPELPEADEEGPATEVAVRLGLELETLRADRQWTLSDPAGLVTEPDSPFTNYYRELWEETYRRVHGRRLETLLTGMGGDHLFGTGGRAYSYTDLLLTGRIKELGRQVRAAGRRSRRGAGTILHRELALPLLRWALPAWRPAGRQVCDWLRPEHHGTFRRWFPPPRRPGSLLPGRSERLMTLRDPLLPQILETTGWHANRHGIELAHPLLDHRLVDFAVSLPTWQTHRNGERKVVLREAMRGILPDVVVDLPGKIYPSAICHRGLREREKDRVRALMTGMRLTELGLVDEKRLRGAYENYLAGAEGTLFWYAVTSESWLREHF